MGWVSRSNPALVDAILSSFRWASFSRSSEEAWSRLARFTASDWAHTEFWLDTSGLGLYFLGHVQFHGLSDAVDARLLQKLEQKRADNSIRISGMLQEFVAINRSFQDAGIRYANLKGFTLFPDSCPDLSLRHQSDYDWLIAPEHLGVGRELLEQRGYRLTASSPRSLEFKTSGPIRSSLDGQYKAANRRSAELHLGMESADSQPGCDPRLDRLHFWRWNSEQFPALSPVDQLIGQALHLLAHLRNEHTRPSWLFEYRRHVMARQDDANFWNSVRALTSEHSETAIALGLANLLAADLFGSFASPEFNAWTVDVLPPRVRLWAEQYGRQAVLADVPGTKLYLLLEDALQEGSKPKPGRIRRLIPLRRPDRILHAAPQETLRSRLRREAIELRFLLFRLRFHLQQGIRFARAARQWRRLCAKPCAEPVQR